MNANQGIAWAVAGAGTKSIAAMCRAIVFRFVPTTLEIVAVASVLTRLFHPALGVIVTATSLAYICFTVFMTQVPPVVGTVGS